MTPQDTTHHIEGGQNQFLPNATKAEQHFYYGNVTNNTGESAASNNGQRKPGTVVILGAGVDATLGIPTSATFIPKIVDYLQTDEGKMVDEQLRKQLKRMTFHFDKFVSNAIDRLAKDLDGEIDNICRNVNKELEENERLDENECKMGRLIVKLFGMIRAVKQGAVIDDETQQLIEDVLGITAKDDAIIDFSRISYTETFKGIIVDILQQSMRKGDSPILRHVYRNLLDIERLLAQYFYGFYSNQTGYIKTYVYISWMMWAFLVHEEKRVLAEHAGQGTPLPIYAQLQGSGCQIISFNYTSYARQCSNDALYFHGSLMEYVDIENKNDFTLDSIADIDLEDFFTNRLPDELSFEGDRRACPIPTFLPPLKLQPVISKRYIATWYKSAEAIAQAHDIYILGCSFSTPDDYFCDMLRANREARITIYDRNLTAVAPNVCRIFQLNPNRYSKQTIDGKEVRTYDNRITLVQGELEELVLKIVREENGE